MKLSEKLEEWQTHTLFNFDELIRMAKDLEGACEDLAKKREKLIMDGQNMHNQNMQLKRDKAELLEKIEALQKSLSFFEELAAQTMGICRENENLKYKLSRLDRLK